MSDEVITSLINSRDARLPPKGKLYRTGSHIDIQSMHIQYICIISRRGGTEYICVRLEVELNQTAILNMQSNFLSDPQTWFHALYGDPPVQAVRKESVCVNRWTLRQRYNHGDIEAPEFDCCFFVLSEKI